jgi:hypothetical protein
VMEEEVVDVLPLVQYLEPVVMDTHIFSLAEIALFQPN